MSKNVSVSPISRGELEDVGKFLTSHLNGKLAPSEWYRESALAWSADAPNCGMKLVSDGRIVGVFLAIYSDQQPRGQVERFCNPHSWCVLPEFRGDAVKLAAALVKQPGYHFSMLSPSPKVEAVFRFMKFKELDRRIAIFPNFPSMTRLSAIDDPDEIRACLSGNDLHDYDNHRTLDWLRHVVVVDKDEPKCWLTFKVRKLKRLPCADIIGISNRHQFGRCLPAIRNYLLFRAGALLGRLESRFVDAEPAFSYRGERSQAKLFLSNTLGDADMRNLYSELVALDL